MALFLVIFWMTAFEGVFRIVPTGRALAADPAKILVLHSYHQGFTWTDFIHQGILSRFQDEDGIELFVEYMDSKRHPPHTLFPELISLYDYKYDNTKIDLIIASDDNAFNFAKQNRSTLFADAPIVFCGVNNYASGDVKEHGDITGVVEAADFLGGIELARRLFPETESIAVISDVTPTGYLHQKNFEAEVVDRLGGELEFIRLYGLTAEELSSSLKRLPHKTAVFTLTFWRDPTGRSFSHRESNSLIVRNSSGPVFTAWDHTLAHGFIGGLVVDGRRQGEVAADMAKRILAGEKTSDIQVMTESPNTPMFDYTVLKRFDVDIHSLPDNHYLVNKPFSFYDKYKSLIWIVTTAFAVSMSVIVLLFVNIIGRRRAEETLLDSERKYRQVIDNANDAIFIAQEGLVKFPNPHTEVITGYSADELSCMPFTSLIHPDHVALVTERYNARLAGEDVPSTYAFKVVNKGKEEIWVQINSVLIEWENRPATLNFVRDINNLKLAEKALIESERRYRNLFEKSTDAIFIIDRKTGICLDANEAALKLSGRPLSAIKRLSIKDLTAEEFDQKIEKVDQFVNVQEIGRITFTRSDGSSRTALLTIVPLDDHIIIGIARDITDEIAMESQLRQSQKLEAIGTLAAGIAHDFNNILSAILGCSELVLAESGLDPSVRGYLEMIHRSGERARDLVAQILTFSRRDERIQSELELNEILEETIKLLRPSIPVSIDIQPQIASSVRVLGDPSRLHQLIMNLCTNAYQAMSETGGVLKLSLSVVHLEGPAAARAQLPRGTYARLMVADTGIGIPPEYLSRIFEPYFTTKPKGKGTGLGLAAVHGIVKSHRGAILVDSQPGKGTRFVILLPTVQHPAISGQATDSNLIGGSERVLLIDDEPDILAVQKEMLQRLGYSVTTQSEALEALSLFRRDCNQFDLVITDLTMPKITGDLLISQLLAIRADIPIIMCSGYGDRIAKVKGRALGVEDFLLKPVTMSDLSVAVRKALDHPRKGQIGR